MPFRHRAAKMLQEERYHLLYAEGWVETLAKNKGTRSELESSMARIWPETLSWFGPAGDPASRTAVREKVIARPGEDLRREFAYQVSLSLRQAGGIQLPESP
jgi:ring-1,2-phenylacetyl-CoA epoxidase subunit PaaA/ring-1,2-phenylacetyl-CoA epoxidase subunit PaaC